MQTLREIRDMLDRAHLRPQKQFGQNFLIDHNLMHKLLDLAEFTGAETVLEVGPATGSLTEELLSRAARVVAVEIDRGMVRLLRQRLGDRGIKNLLLLHTDVLDGKTAVSRQVIGALGPTAWLVANLPYSIATPLVAQCMIDSWHACRGGDGGRTVFDRMVFTVQREVAQRFAAPCGGRDYGPVSILLQLLGRITPGAVLPASAFWPQPKVASQIMRIDFDAHGARAVDDIATLRTVLSMAFAQRRKQVGSILRRRNVPFAAASLSDAMSRADIDPASRAERITPGQFRLMANALTRRS